MTLRKTTRAGSFGFMFSAGMVMLHAVLGCNQGVDSASRAAPSVEKLDIFVVNYPLAFFAERIGGELVEVSFPVPPDQDPALWAPADHDIARFQSADVIFINGADYAKWTLRSSLPLSRTVVTTRNVAEQIIEVPNMVTHTHGPEGEHSHAGVAPETWIDPQLALSQAQVVKDELQKRLPDSTNELEANFAELKNDLQRLNENLNAAFSSSPRSWMASHPAFQYLGRRYDLELQTMHWNPTEAPSDEQWAELDRLLGGAESSCMLWTETPNRKTLDGLEQRGVRVVVFHLAANRHASGDYLSIMHENHSELQGVLKPQ